MKKRKFCGKVKLMSQICQLCRSHWCRLCREICCMLRRKKRTQRCVIYLRWESVGMWQCMGRECWTPLPDTHHRLSYDTWGEGGRRRKKGEEVLYFSNSPRCIVLVLLTLVTACRWWCRVWHRGWPEQWNCFSHMDQ